MTPRSIRRAAERKAMKEARKDEASRLSEPKTQLDEAAFLSEPKTQLTPARLAANHANTQLSEGPRTPQGKAKSCINATKTALTGRTVLLPTDHAAVYQQHVQDFANEFQPLGPHESELVQALADHAWRLNRIASLEMAIYAYGHEQFAEQFTDRGVMQAGFIQMHTFLHYEKQLRNLQIQESRIRRNREKDTAELRRLQQERLAPAGPTAAVPLTARAVGSLGFDFSSSAASVETNAPAPGSPLHQAASSLPFPPELASNPPVAASASTSMCA